MIAQVGLSLSYIYPVSSSPPAALTLETCEWLQLSGKQEARSKHLKEVLKEKQRGWIGVLGGFPSPLPTDECYNSDLISNYSSLS